MSNRAEVPLLSPPPERKRAELAKVWQQTMTHPDVSDIDAQDWVIQLLANGVEDPDNPSRRIPGIGKYVEVKLAQLIKATGESLYSQRGIYDKMALNGGIQEFNMGPLILGIHQTIQSDSSVVNRILGHNQPKAPIHIKDSSHPEVLQPGAASARTLIDLSTMSIQGLVGWTHTVRALGEMAASGDPDSAAQFIKAFLVVSRRLQSGNSLVRRDERAMSPEDARARYGWLAQFNPNLRPQFGNTPSPIELVAATMSENRSFVESIRRTPDVGQLLTTVGEIVATNAAGWFGVRNQLADIESQVLHRSPVQSQDILGRYHELTTTVRSLGELEYDFQLAQQVFKMIPSTNEDIEAIRGAEQTIRSYRGMVQQFTAQRVRLIHEIAEMQRAMLIDARLAQGDIGRIQRTGEYGKMFLDHIYMIVGTLTTLEEIVETAALRLIQAGERSAREAFKEAMMRDVPQIAKLEQYAAAKRKADIMNMISAPAIIAQQRTTNLAQMADQIEEKAEHEIDQANKEAEERLKNAQVVEEETVSWRRPATNRPSTGRFTRRTQ